MSKYVSAAIMVLSEAGGSMTSGEMIQAIVAKGLLPDRKYLYHNILRKIRLSPGLFDTSVRGRISLIQKDPAAAPVADVVMPPAPLPIPAEEAAPEAPVAGNWEW